MFMLRIAHRVFPPLSDRSRPTHPTVDATRERGTENKSESKRDNERTRGRTNEREWNERAVAKNSLENCARLEMSSASTAVAATVAAVPAGMVRSVLAQLDGYVSDALATVAGGDASANVRREATHFRSMLGRFRPPTAAFGGAGIDAAPIADARAAIRATFVAMPAWMCEQAPPALLDAQEQLLTNEAAAAGIVDASQLPRVPGSLVPAVVWQGDMARLRVDACVNPGNQALLGCFLPTHRCLDNILHAQAGPRLRKACAERLRELGISEDGNGLCRVTAGFALPSKHVLHTVGPCLVDPRDRRRPARAPTDADRRELASCYTTCLDTAVAMGLSSVAFCCISTGEFGYPNAEATALALATVRDHCRALVASGKVSQEKAPLVVFNVFKDEDLALYTEMAPAILSDPQAR